MGNIQGFVCMRPAGQGAPVSPWLVSVGPHRCAAGPLPRAPFPGRELRRKFEAKCGEFMSALAEGHRSARSARAESREELEGLLNLMARLDFNGYFSGQGLGGGGAE